jgi:hypothetical protein
MLRCCCCLCRWGETMSLNCGHRRAYCSSRDEIWVWRPSGMILTGEYQRSWEKACPSANLSMAADCHSLVLSLIQTVLLFALSYNVYPFAQHCSHTTLNHRLIVMLALYCTGSALSIGCRQIALYKCSSLSLEVLTYYSQCLVLLTSFIESTGF